MKIIFLDFDGVLNSWEFQEREIARDPSIKGGVIGIDPLAVARLNRIVKETGAYVVVSSTWRRLEETNTVRKLQELLDSKGFEGRVVGRTAVLWSGHRGREIDHWLEDQDQRDWRSNDVESFVILDDDSDMEPHMSRLVQTSMDDGLQDRHVDQAIYMLGLKS